MPMTPQSGQVVAWAFPRIAETVYGTALADAALIHRTAFLNPEFAQILQNVESDVQLYGKGHPFATTERKVADDVRFSRSFYCSSLMAGFAAAFGMGAVSTTGVGPYTHVCTFQNMATSAQAKSFTVYELLASAVAHKLPGMAINRVTFSGRNQQLVQVQIEVIGSGGRTAGTITLPAMTAQSIFNQGDVTVELGAQGAAADMSDQVLEWSVTIAQNLSEQFGYYPGSSTTRGRMWVGKQTARADLKLFLTNDAVLHNLAIGRTLSELKITCAFDASNSMEIFLPGCRFELGAPEVQGEQMAINLTTGEGGVFKEVGGTPDEPIQITVTNGITAYFA